MNPDDARAMFPLALLWIAAQMPTPDDVGERPVVLLVPVDDNTERDVDGIYAAFAARGMTGVGPLSRIGVDVAPDAQRFENASVDETKDRLLVARAALNDFNSASALDALDEAEALFLRLERPDAAGELYAEILLVRADAALTLGDTERAVDALWLLSRLEPDRTALHPGLYPPTLVDTYRDAREKNRTERTVPVIITLSDDDASSTVLVDLRPISVSSDALVVDEGPHVVTVLRAGRLTVSERIDAKEGDPLIRAPVLVEPGADRARFSLVNSLRVDPRNLAARAKLARLTGANHVVTLGEHIMVSTDDVPLLTVESDSRDRAIIAARVLAALDDARRPPVINSVASVEEVEPASIWPLAIGGGVGSVLVLGTVVATSTMVLLYVFRPRNDPPKEKARPVIIGCCGEVQQ